VRTMTAAAATRIIVGAGLAPKLAASNATLFLEKAPPAPRGHFGEQKLPTTKCLHWVGAHGGNPGDKRAQVQAGGRKVLVYEVLFRTARPAAAAARDTNGWVFGHRCDDSRCCNPYHLKVWPKSEDIRVASLHRWPASVLGRAEELPCSGGDRKMTPYPKWHRSHGWRWAWVCRDCKASGRPWTTERRMSVDDVEALREARPELFRDRQLVLW